MRRFAPQLFAQVFCLPLILLLVSDSQCQYPIKPRTGRQVIENRELVSPEFRQESNPQYELIAQLALRADFRKLQLLNIDLLKRTRGQSTSDNTGKKEIRSNLGEIKKLAIRLRTNLGIPKVDESSSSYDLAFAPGVILLDKAITSFVENPLLQQPKVFNEELALQAGRDISEIVRLSEFLRRLTKDN